MSEQNEIPQENQTPEPEWVAELKTWGIDVVAFRQQWENTGDEAKAKFKDALVKAEADYEAGAGKLDAKLDEVRDDVEEFVQRLGTAWEEMVSSIQEYVQPASKDDDSADKDA